ncbi:P-loop NTPase fold protein [Streptococcus suis]|uniref:KAP_NTPase n=1 Tax=Streptococcus suis TaxID=1307 RepID=A0AB33UGF4_STRSU|nr:P-loop NTPase fold protein [Streptococcus suis]MCQ9224597.1 P-loop NTPase fold protein [Streptococcus suis]MCQ9231349.1 P-loop NTPase fold protein [Streptococcus suis]UUM23738.1 P-loop NTPase fold protein [Streptococcus suis]CYU99945.1 KAP_NTPase [Streptococcus suis]CYV05081.1 KAP_NTPase [Streptococcus suis]
MKEKICKKLKELAKKPVRRIDWSGERWFVRRYKQGLALGWIIYFLLREELVKEILKPVSNYLMNFSCIQWFYVNKLTVLLVFTALLFLAKSIFSILRWCEVIRYFPLGKKKYPEYDFPFQEELVSFLNRKEERGRNIFWLNGAWGSGKTHFIRTFFENQLYKSREIYYISCFGIRTREQAEKVLIDEIEQHSTFGSLDHIPVVSSLVKWSYKILGLDLMKKHSIVIFDDLERVAYSEKKGDSQEEYTDSPEDYNDLLGFIDHLANHRNQKVLVLMNKEDMGNTYQKIVEEKFKPTVATIPDQDKIIELVVERYCDELFVREFLTELFKLLSCWNPVNLREIQNSIEQFRIIFGQKGSYDIVVLDILNKWSNLREFLFDYNAQVKNKALYSPYYQVIYLVDNLIYDFEQRGLDEVKIDKELKHYQAMMAVLWRKGYKNLIWSYNSRAVEVGEETKQYAMPEYSALFVEKLLVEIYYDLQDDNLKQNYIFKRDIEEVDKRKRLLIPHLKPTIKINGKQLGSLFTADELESYQDNHFNGGNAVRVRHLKDWQAYFASQTNEGDTP